VILVDHAAEYLPALHRCVQGYDDRLVMIGWPLVPGLVGPVPVALAGEDIIERASELGVAIPDCSGPERHVG
jgi:hypothetical protein